MLCRALRKGTIEGDSEGMELASVFPKVSKGRLRRRILDLVRTMAQEGDTLDDA